MFHVELLQSFEFICSVLFRSINLLQFFGILIAVLLVTDIKIIVKRSEAFNLGCTTGRGVVI